MPTPETWTPGGLDSFGPTLVQYFPLKLLLLLLLLLLEHAVAQFVEALR
jgi:hypothetical protein